MDEEKEKRRHAPYAVRFVIHMWLRANLSTAVKMTREEIAAVIKTTLQDEHKDFPLRGSHVKHVIYENRKEFADLIGTTPRKPAEGEESGYRTRIANLEKFSTVAAEQRLELSVWIGKVEERVAHIEKTLGILLPTPSPQSPKAA